MKVEYINPFIESVYNLFATMLESKVERGEIGIAKEPNDGMRRVTALIGFSGQARGSVALSFPVPTALSMVGKLLGTPTKVLDDTVYDAIAELVNIVAGGSKAKFTNGSETRIQLGLPTVINGNDYDIGYPSEALWLEVPFRSDLGPFSLHVSFEMDSKAGDKE